MSLFHSLCKTIVYQQLAGKAAKTIFDRFVKLFVGEDAAADAFPTPAEIVSASVEKLRTAGLSERKVNPQHVCPSCLANQPVTNRRTGLVHPGPGQARGQQ